jgi:lipopolysaccharide export LptBFGC system permease protein LptF
MSRTLFYYVLKDLVRVFLLTAGALAGIMSFGGLLRPLTEHGLNAGQVGQMLAYFMPAMMTYSLPIAALFATTTIYGRLAADNEITGMRAAGISHLSISTPAMVLGLLVAMVSLLFLCFIVPVFSLKVERVIYKNLAQLVAGEIQRTRQIRWADQTIYAQQAEVAPPEAGNPGQQVVTLSGVMVVSYGKGDEVKGRLRVPAEFYLASRATAVIRPDPRTDGYLVNVVLEGGSSVPREISGARQGGLDAMSVGPFLIESPIKEATKFMDIRRLHELYGDRTRSRRVQKALAQLARSEQSKALLREVSQDLATRGRYRFDAGRDVFEVQRQGPAPPQLAGDELIVPGPVHLVEESQGRVVETTEAQEVRISARPDSEQTMAVSLRVLGATRQVGNEVFRRRDFIQPLTVPMSPTLRELSHQPPAYFLSAGHVPSDDRASLQRVLIRLSNGIQSELHARASFAVSCFILVLVGCALGLMFRSGNFLSAFAISVVPALLCVTLIVTGQRMSEGIPSVVTASFANSQLTGGLTLIWSGNAIVAVLAVVLLWRLQRQ